MSWTPLREPVDFIRLAGRESPGIATVTGASSPRRWDVRKGYALSGATTVFRGMDVAKFKVALRLYSEEDWDAWHSWKELVQRPPSGTRPRALDIWHPVLEDCGIKSAVVENVSQPEQTTADGEWTITIDFIEHRARQPISIMTEGSDATDTESEKQRAIRLAREESERLSEELGSRIRRLTGGAQ